MEESVHITCDNCGGEVPAGHSFCGRCGGKVEAPQTLSSPTRPISTLMPRGKARLVALEGSALMPGMAFHLNGTDHGLGRVHGVILVDDPFLSPAHGKLSYDEAGKLWIDDEGSFNGVYVRVRERVTLTSEVRFMMGRQIFQFNTISHDERRTDAQDTRTYGSPRKNMRMRVLHILQGGLPGRAWAMGEGEVSFGRANSTIDLSHDELVSRLNARIVFHQGVFVLEDMGSTNGTFLCVRGRHQLQHGDEIYLGQHLLRVEFNA